jgi:hypothetical protein
MIKITESNYTYYKQIFSVIWSFHASMANLDPNVFFSPIHVLNAFEEKSKSLARKSLKEGLMENFSTLKYLTPESKAALNNLLISNNYPPLDQLAIKISRLPQKVIKRGKINNLVEYHAIKEVLVDTDTDISQTDRATLEQIFQAFEMEYKGTE